MSQEKTYSISIKDKDIKFKDLHDLSAKLEAEIYKPRTAESGIIQKYEKDIIISSVSELIQKEPESTNFEYHSLKVTSKGNESNIKTTLVMKEVNRVLEIYSLKTKEMSANLKYKSKFYAEKLSEKINLLQDKYKMEVSKNLSSLNENSLESILFNIIKDNNLEAEKITLISIKNTIKKEFESSFNIISTDNNMMFQNLGLAIGFLNEQLSKNKMGKVELIQRISSLRKTLDDIYNKMPWMRKEIMNYKIKNE